jgi:hypothetical protein
MHDAAEDVYGCSSAYSMPALKLTDVGPIQKHTVNARYTIALKEQALAALPAPSFRIREQLLVTLVNHIATHVVRPGFLSFRG